MSMKFKRVAAAFDEAVAASSGSEHWPEEESGSGDLSDLVNSFIHGDDDNGDNYHDHHDSHNEEGEGEEGCGDDDGMVDERKERLMMLLEGDGGSGGEAVAVVESFINGMTSGGSTDGGVKRRLMAHLRDQGYDAGLCKSRWEKMGRYPAGDYEYVDIKIAGTRHIVEFFLAGEFHIARPAARYSSLLSMLPSVYIGTPETLKQVVRLMATAMKESLKSMDLHVAPWRRNGYMNAKWFGPYKRTVNEVPRKMVSGGGSSLPVKKSLGFVTSPTMRGGFCRDGLGSGINGVRVGLLAAAFQGR